MSFLTGFGGFLGGINQEASAIREERFRKQQQSSNMAASMLQHVMENPHATDEIKAQAAEALRDIVMYTIFPDQFKPKKGNVVGDLVNKFVGQQDASQQIAERMGQVGVGRGNAKTQVGGATPQQGPQGPPPLPPGMNAQVQGMPVPQMAPQAPPVPPPQMVRGSMEGDPGDEYEQELRAKAKANPSNEWFRSKEEDELTEYTGAKGKAKAASALKREEAKADMDLDFERASRSYQEIVTKYPQLLNYAPDIVGSQLAGRALAGSANPVDSPDVPVATAAKMLGKTVEEVSAMVGGAPYVRMVRDARTHQPTGQLTPSNGPLSMQNATVMAMQQALQAEAAAKGMDVETYRNQFPMEASRIMNGTRLPNRVGYSWRTVQQADGSTNLVEVPTSSNYQFPTGTASPATDGGNFKSITAGGRPPTADQTKAVGDSAQLVVRMRELKDAITATPEEDFGPIIGRMTEWLSRNGLNVLIPEDRQQLQFMIDSNTTQNTFKLGGKQLTANEIGYIQRAYPQLRQGKRAALQAVDIEIKRLEQDVNENIRNVPPGSRGGVDQSFKDVIDFDKKGAAPPAKGDIRKEYEDFLKKKK